MRSCSSSLPCTLYITVHFNLYSLLNQYTLLCQSYMCMTDMYIQSTLYFNVHTAHQDKSTLHTVCIILPSTLLIRSLLTSRTSHSTVHTMYTQRHSAACYQGLLYRVVFQYMYNDFSHIIITSIMNNEQNFPHVTCPFFINCM